MRRVRIVLCDDHGLVRRGVGSLLEDVPGYEVVGEAADSDEEALSSSIMAGASGYVLKQVREIAGRMGLAEKTVKNYVSNILGKLGLSRRTQAAAYVARRHPASFAV
jgi:DNA-binding NarL/FixJ family response regulator